MPERRVRVCFVCLGNICRSPTAEGVMQRIVDNAGLGDHVVVDSAGTAAHHVGERADARARKAAKKRGLALTSRARQFRPTDFGEFDYVLAMDAANLANLEALGGSDEFRGQLRLLRDFDPIMRTGCDIPDPYYGGENGFEEVLDFCEAACRGLFEEIERNIER